MIDVTKLGEQVSSTPATRLDVLALQEQLDTRLKQRQARDIGICPIRRELYSQCFGMIFMLYVNSCFAYSYMTFVCRRIDPPSNRQLCRKRLSSSSSARRAQLDPPLLPDFVRKQLGLRRPESHSSTCQSISTIKFNRDLYGTWASENTLILLLHFILTSDWILVEIVSNKHPNRLRSFLLQREVLSLIKLHLLLSSCGYLKLRNGSLWSPSVIHYSMTRGVIRNVYL